MSPPKEKILAGITEYETEAIETNKRFPGFVETGESDSKRRFTVSVVIGLAVSAVPYIWVLSDLWSSSPSLFRTAEANGYAGNFYDLQARAVFHGHLYVANGSLGAEAFVHAGRQYTYFGLFPSLLRMPVLVFTHGLDGQLTVLSMLSAWLITALFSSLLVWRVRLLLRGPASLSRIEAGSYGVLIAAIMGGSVLVFLASNPYAFSEDLAWSVALTVGSMFALLGVLEKPMWSRVIACGALILAANLNRATTGYSCVIGAMLVGIWFIVGRSGADNRRWALPMLAAGLVPLAVGCAISYAKFGILFGLPTSEQIVYQIFGLGHINNGSYFGLRFLPSTLLAYLQPVGLRLTPVFPFITLPTDPARGVGGVLLDGTARVASVPSSMPLLFLGGLWGVISAFRPHPFGRSTLLRIVLIATAAGAGTVFIFAWVENPYTADVLPFLIVAGTVGIVDVWRRLDGKSRSVRCFALTIVTALGVFGVAANVGMASTPQGTWSSDQALRYVEFQKNVSDMTGRPLAENVVRSNTLPNYAPPDKLFVVGDCAALYISDGEGSFHGLNLGVLWHAVELGPGLRHTVILTFHGPITDIGATVPLVTIGTKSVTTIAVQPYGTSEVRFSVEGGLGSAVSAPVPIQESRPYRFTILTDPYNHIVSVTSQEAEILHGFTFSKGHIVVNALHSNFGRPPLPMTVVNATGPAPSMTLCRSLP